MNWIKKSLNRQMVSILVVSMTLLGILVFSTENYLVKESEHYSEEIKEMFHEAERAAALQKEFKTQVQEWKNVLLRGYKESDRDKYWGKFQSSEAKVQKLVEEIQEHDKHGRFERILEKFESAHSSMGVSYRSGYRAYITSGSSSNAGDAAVRGIDREPSELIDELVRVSDDAVDSLIEEQEMAMVKAEYISLTLLVVFMIVLTLIILWLIRKTIIQPMSEIVTQVGRYGDGETVDFNSDRLDELGLLNKTLSQMKESQEKRIASDREKANANAAIKLALDKCQANVMFANNDLEITYVNDSVIKMLSNREASLQRQIPNFKVSSLVGTCVDVFHKNPSHQRGMLASLRDAYETKLKLSELTFELIATPVFDEKGTRLGTVVEWDDITERLARETTERELAQENAGIKMALDKCQANVMFANTDLEITYINEAVTEMLTGRETELRSVLPNFNVKNLVGTCVDDFHKTPSHQRGMIENLKTTYNTQLNLAGLTFNLIATPVIDSDGTRLGTVVEWDDITEKLARETAERAQAQENAGIKMALDKCQANVMYANADLEITYLNDAVINMLSNRERELQSLLPNFRVKDLIGTCVDDFHKNPAHQRGLLADLREPYETSLKLSGLTFNLIASPVVDSEGTRLGTVVEWDDVTIALAKQEEADRVANENARIKQALDSVTANTMLADDDGDIVYANNAVISMLRVAESDIRQALPNFNSDKVIGSNFDIFHKNPAHQRNMLASLTSTYRTEIEVAGRTFSLIANPIFNEDKERLGTVVEWNDRTAEVKAESEIGSLINGASKGDLTVRIPTEGKEGFFKLISDGLNQLVAIADGVINDSARVLDAMSHGKLTEKIEEDYEGIYGKLKRDANQTTEKLTDIIGQIRQSSMNVSSAADEIAQGNADLSQRTEEQASSLEETASSMEEMTSTVKQAADNAEEANSLAEEAKAKAQQGGDVVTKAVGAMEEINVASKKISDIIGVIDEIAFQTNLLALNAAVEAARAGEQGRGFAVVAGEVRNLAQRSAGAAKEIKDLIRDSVSKVEDGTALVNESGNTLSEIVDAVQKVTSMVADISSAAREQTSGIEQVNTAVSQMDEMTQQNAALVEEASAAAEAMAEQSRKMTNLVGFFTMDEGGSSNGAILSPAIASIPAPAKASSPAQGVPVGVSVTNSDDDWDEF